MCDVYMCRVVDLNVKRGTTAERGGPTPVLGGLSSYLAVNEESYFHENKVGEVGPDSDVR